MQMPETITLNMTNQAAVNIIVHLLTGRNPSTETVETCRAELLRMASIVDDLIETKKKEN